MASGGGEDDDILSWLKEEEDRRKKKKKQKQVLLNQEIIAALVQNGQAKSIAALALDDEDELLKVDHRTLPRAKRRLFSRDRAQNCIMEDYLGPIPIFNDRQFEVMFRISKSRFERLRQDVAARKHPFYTPEIDMHGNQCASLEARLLLPLKSLAYGVPPHCFMDYFQMSETLARECCIMFDKIIPQIYVNEYLRHPTQSDCKALSKLHQNVHCFSGMFGSLDCMHTFWKNCPVAWQGAYKGKEKKPTIVLEAIADYLLWFWHAAYGHPGTLNDLNVLALSPFLGMLLDGRFAELERGACPFKIGREQFEEMYVLVDGIYPAYTRFVHGIKEPANIQEKKYTKWQEGCRKDIERAFGVLQAEFQCMARPFQHINPDLIGERVATCLILHNMCVSDRVMLDVHAQYNPSSSIVGGINTVDQEDAIVDQPDDLFMAQGGGTSQANRATVGTNNCSVPEIRALTRAQRWKGLRDGGEVQRLHTALLKGVNRLRADAIAARRIDA